MLQNLRDASPGWRLRQARERAGFERAADFARANNINYTTYAHHENGRRDIGREVAKVYARLLNMPPGTLLYGEDLPSLPPIPITGRIGAQGRVSAISSHLQRRPIKLPDPMQLVGTQIVGDDLYPAYRDGDVVLHRALIAEDLDVRSLHGLECVVETVNGDMMLRQVLLQSDGSVTLLTHGKPPLLDQRLRAAAAVEIVQRRLTRQQPQY